MEKRHPVCRTCKSDDVAVDAWAEWNADAQQWEVADTFDAAWCRECDGETSIEWVEPVAGDTK